MGALLLAYLASAAFTTSISVLQLQHGCVERNPFAPSSMHGQIAFKGGATAGFMVGITFADTHREHGLARAIALLGIGSNVVVGIHDARQHCR